MWGADSFAGINVMIKKKCSHHVKKHQHHDCKDGNKEHHVHYTNIVNYGNLAINGGWIHAETGGQISGNRGENANQGGQIAKRGGQNANQDGHVIKNAIKTGERNKKIGLLKR